MPTALVGKRRVHQACYASVLHPQLPRGRGLGAEGWVDTSEDAPSSLRHTTGKTLALLGLVQGRHETGAHRAEERVLHTGINIRWRDVSKPSTLLRVIWWRRFDDSFTLTHQ